MRFRKFPSIALVVAILVSVGSGLAQSPPISADTKSEVEKRVTDLLTKKAYVPTVDFSRLQDFLKGEQSKIDSAKTEDEFTRDINEAFTKFGASHIYLMSPRAVDARQSGSMVGIGISQQRNPDGSVLVMRVVPGAPADKAGLVPGDTIVQVNGQKADGTKGIIGPEGTQVRLSIKKADGTLEDKILVRAKFSTVRPEELTEVNKDTVKLTIYTFDWTYDNSHVEELMRKAHGYKNLILDLRDNGGGAVVNLQYLLGFFLPPDAEIGTFVKKELVDSYVEETGGQPSEVVKIAKWSRDREEWNSQQIRPISEAEDARFKGQVVILINGLSGSASEIAAAALHDLDHAKLVGQKSAGAVLVSVIVPAGNQVSLQYPIMDYVTIKGVRLEGNGLVPTVTVDQIRPKFNEADLAVEKAESLLSHDKSKADNLETLKN